MSSRDTVWSEHSLSSQWKHGHQPPNLLFITHGHGQRAAGSEGHGRGTPNSLVVFSSIIGFCQQRLRWRPPGVAPHFNISVLHDFLL